MGLGLATLVLGVGIGIGRVDTGQTTEWNGRLSVVDHELGHLGLRVPIVSTVVPRRIGIDETKAITASLRSERPGRFEATLESPSFDIKSASVPVASEALDFHWKWLVTPKKTGTHALSLTLSQIHTSKFDLHDRNDITRVEVKSPFGERTVDIYVVTEMGLTSKQDAWVKALGAVLGLIGTVVGYPFFKRYFERSSAASGDSGSAPSSSVVKSKKLRGRGNR